MVIEIFPFQSMRETKPMMYSIDEMVSMLLIPKLAPFLRCPVPVFRLKQKPQVPPTVLEY